MVFEVQLAVTRFYLPLIGNLTTFNLCLHRILLFNVEYLSRNQKLSKEESSQREAVAEVVRHFPINLASNDTCGVTDCLLETD